LQRHALTKSSIKCHRDKHLIRLFLYFSYLTEMWNHTNKVVFVFQLLNRNVEPHKKKAPYIFCRFYASPESAGTRTARKHLWMRHICVTLCRELSEGRL